MILTKKGKNIYDTFVSYYGTLKNRREKQIAFCSNFILEKQCDEEINGV
jgi:hypothetical protein